MVIKFDSLATFKMHITNIDRLQFDELDIYYRMVR